MRAVRFVLLFLSVGLLSCCGKVDSVPVSAEVVDVEFRGVCASAVKSPSVDEESVVSLDVLVFRQDGGALECHSRAAGGVVSVSVVSGAAYRWYAVANAPEGSFADASDEGRFRDLSWSLLSLSSGMAMVGSGSGVLSSGGSVTVNLDRLACRVVLDAFSPDFLLRMYPYADVRLERVFLLNVNGLCPWTAVPAVSDVWYNRIQKVEEGAAVDTLVCVEHGMVLSGASVVSLGDVLYCCPNPVEQDTDVLTEPEWSPRRTRLIIELGIDGVPNYYPVTLPVMLCNRSYEVTLATAVGPGFASADCCSVARSPLVFSVSVLPWDDGGDIPLGM